MPETNIENSHRPSFLLWNIFQKNKEPPERNETSAPILNEIISVTPTRETFNIPEMEDGHYLRLAAEGFSDEYQKPPQPDQQCNNNGWKLKAALMAITGLSAVLGGTALYFKYSGSTASRSPAPLSDNLSRGLPGMNAINPGAQQSAYLVSSPDSPRTAALSIFDIPINTAHSKLNWVLSNDIKLEELQHEIKMIKGIIAEGLKRKALSATNNKILARKLAYLIRAKIEPFMESLKETHRKLTDGTFSDNIKWLRLEAVNFEIDKTYQIIKSLKELIISMNKDYIRIITHGAR